MDDIREWHIGLAILVAAAIHALSTGLYLTLLRPIPVQVPPPLIVRLPPPAPPAVRQELPAVAMPRPPAPVPVPLPAPEPALPTVALPETEEPPPAVEPEPTPAPQPLDLTQFDLPEIATVPVPRPKPAPPAVAAAPIAPPKPAAAQPVPAAPTATLPSGRKLAQWPRRVEELSPTQRHRLLEEYYIDNKANWQPWYESRDDAWRRLNMGFANPKAPYDIIDMIEPSRRDLLPPGFDINVGPLTVQEAEAALKEMIAAGTKAVIGRNVKSINNLSFRERDILLKKRFGDDPRWMVGLVDPKAKKDYLAQEGNANSIAASIGMTQPPLTVQEIEETLDRLVALGTGHVIGRNVETADELNDGERDALLRKYYENDPRWDRGIIDPTVPLDHLDPATLGPSRKVFTETVLTIQEVEETLRKMLEQKRRAQDAASSGR